jgi:hypothetical protein
MGYALLDRESGRRCCCGDPGGVHRPAALVVGFCRYWWF